MHEKVDNRLEWESDWVQRQVDRIEGGLPLDKFKIANSVSSEENKQQDNFQSDFGLQLHSSLLEGASCLGDIEIFIV